MSAVVPADFVAFGRPATLALGQAIRALEGDDPLTPVTVVVPSNLAGLTARRLLGGVLDHDDGAPRQGLINVSFLTPYQLAAQLGSGVMARARRLPMTSPVLTAAVRAALAAHTGSFQPVARHVATEVAVARAYTELSRASDGSLDALRASPRVRTQDLLAIIDDTRSRLAGYHDENDLVTAALGELATDSAAAAATLGSLVVHLIDDVSPSVLDLLGELVAVVPSRLVVGLTGEDAADAGALAVASRLSPQSSGTVELELATDATRLIEAADPDEEVRAVVRSIAAQIDAHEPLDRTVVLYPVSDPYLRTLHDQLDAAGITHNGPAGRHLADSVVGRLVSRLLDQVVSGGDDPRHLLRRQGLIDIVSAAPIRGTDGRALPATSFDLLSRRAGVIGGIDDWTEKLDRHGANLVDRRAIEERDGASAGRLAALDREQTDTAALREFVVHLAARLDPANVPPSWRSRTQWLNGLLADLLPPEDQRQQWPEVEVGAAEAIIDVIERTAVLDEFDADASFGSFARTIQGELDATTVRRGRFGEGVLVAPLVAAVGLDVDFVYLLGCREGTLPPIRREDSLLPDDERRRAGDGELPLRRSRTVSDRRDFLATQRMGARRVTLVHGSGDHRTGKAQLPSRWLLEVAGALAHPDGTPLLSSDWPTEVHHLHPLYPHLLKLRSFHEGIQRAPAAAALTDHDLGRLVAYRESGQPLDTHHVFAVDQVLARGHAVVQARQSDDFTRFDGNLTNVALGDGSVDHVLSATRLETWATCPMRYFLANELGLGEVERPEEIVELSPLDRGSLIHLVLEDFLAPVVGAPIDERPRPETPWTDADRARLFAIAESRFTEYEQRGLTGKALLWTVHRQQLLADLEQWLLADNELRRALGSVPEAVEMRIGFEGEPPLTVTLSDGRELRFRGYADRVDRGASDGAPVVLDYKTGKTGLIQKRLDEDPVQGGTKLQLSLYAEAARQRFGSEAAAAYYWYTSTPGQFVRLGYDYTSGRQERFRDVVSTIVSGIEAGLFVTNSGDYDTFWSSFDNCKWCDFDSLCPRDRSEQSAAKQQDPAAAPYRSLVEAEIES